MTPTTAALRDRLAARGRLRTLTAPAPEEVAVPPRAHFRAGDPEPDPRACVHPAEYLRYDGDWDAFDPPRAQVTCDPERGGCGHSPTLPMSERELARRRGGERAHGGGPGSEVRMPERKDG